MNENESEMNDNDYRFDFGIVNKKGNTALIGACLLAKLGGKFTKNGRALRNFANEKIQLLVEKDHNIRQNVNIINNDKQTALSIVKKCDLGESVKLIENQMLSEAEK